MLKSTIRIIACSAPFIIKLMIQLTMPHSLPEGEGNVKIAELGKPADW